MKSKRKIKPVACLTAYERRRKRLAAAVRRVDQVRAECPFYEACDHELYRAAKAYLRGGR